MDGSLALGPAERKRLMAMFRKHPDAEVRRRAQIVLWLADGWTWSQVAAGQYCSSRTIDRWKKRFEAGGVEALLGERRGRRSPFPGWVVAMVVDWVTSFCPTHFGFLRSRWTCECLAVLPLNVAAVRVSRRQTATMVARSPDRRSTLSNSARCAGTRAALIQAASVNAPRKWHGPRFVIPPDHHFSLLIRCRGTKPA